MLGGRHLFWVIVALMVTGTTLQIAAKAVKFSAKLVKQTSTGDATA
jgi:hypothetical protein